MLELLVVALKQKTRALKPVLCSNFKNTSRVFITLSFPKKDFFLVCIWFIEMNVFANRLRNCCHDNKPVSVYLVLMCLNYNILVIFMFSRERVLRTIVQAFSRVKSVRKLS
jgi:hypothetical protein